MTDEDRERDTKYYKLSYLFNFLHTLDISTSLDRRHLNLIVRCQKKNDQSSINDFYCVFCFFFSLISLSVSTHYYALLSENNGLYFNSSWIATGVKNSSWSHYFNI